MASLNDVSTPRLQAVRSRSKELPEGNYIMSLDNPKEHVTAGKIFVADARKTAECEYDMTHRICTEEEVDAYRETEEKQRQSYVNRENARRQQLNINVQAPQPHYEARMQQFADLDLKDNSDLKGLPKKVK